jgi:hypothetical protein
MALDDTGQRNAALRDLRGQRLVRGTIRLRYLATTFARLVGAGRCHADLALARGNHPLRAGGAATLRRRETVLRVWWMLD